LPFDPCGQERARRLVEFEGPPASDDRRPVAVLFDASAPRRTDGKTSGDCGGLFALVIKLQHALSKCFSVGHDETVKPSPAKRNGARKCYALR